MGIRSRWRRAFPRVIAGAFLAAPGARALADYQLNLPPPATSIARRVLELHNLILVISAVIFVIVFGFMFYAIVAHRKSRGVTPAMIHDNVYLEATWTIIPFLILVGMAVPSTATLIEMADVSRSEMTVQVTGYQWRWQYEYMEHDVAFFSTLATPRAQIENRARKGEDYLLEVDNPLVLPVGKKIRLLLTANDVIHSWWVPQLGFKADAVPGFIREVWINIDAPGVYRGVCAEFCGKDHAYMPVVVEAVPPEDFEEWVLAQKEDGEAMEAAKTWGRAELMARGEQVYQQVCAACHGRDGKGVAGAFPAIAGSPVAAGPVGEHIATVVRGRNTGEFPAPMPAFGPQLSNVEIAAVVTFERNAFGNEAGELVEPAEVQAAR